MDQTQVEEIEISMQYIIQNHPARKDYQTSEEFDTLVSEAETFADATLQQAANPF
jgi:NADH:ubiquinone oxidoreductase subunit C